MKSDIPKQFIPILGKRLSLYSFELFASLKDILEIIVVCPKGTENLFPSLSHLPVRFAEPGERRQDSVYNGFSKCSTESMLICIHDSARPLIRKEEIEKVMHAAKEYRAASLAVPLKVTIKEGDQQGMVRTTLDRSTLFEIQTPQAMTPDLLRKGLANAIEKNLTVTDDVSLVEMLNEPVKLVQGSYCNIKVTTKDDLHLAELLLKSREQV
jgi:2-C-methyl-D-erythritol 4-phosphate cytidylyltransferase